MRSEVLQGTLTKNQRKFGLFLEEYGDHILFLKFRDRIIQAYHSASVLVKNIQDDADRFINGG